MLNFLLIPSFAGIGAAIATVIAYAIAAFLANGLNLKTRKIFMIQLNSFLLFSQ